MRPGGQCALLLSSTLIHPLHKPVGNIREEGLSGVLHMLAAQTVRRPSCAEVQPGFPLRGTWAVGNSREQLNRNKSGSVADWILARTIASELEGSRLTAVVAPSHTRHVWHPRPASTR